MIENQEEQQEQQPEQQVKEQIINERIYVGEINKLAVYRKSEPGIYLISEDREEVLLPSAYVTNERELGGFLDVFSYTDREDRLVATTLDPYLYVNEYAYLEIVDTAAFASAAATLEQILLFLHTGFKTTVNTIVFASKASKTLQILLLLHQSRQVDGSLTTN